MLQGGLGEVGKRGLTMNETLQPNQKLTEGECAIALFEAYLDEIVKGTLPDPDRFKKDFFEVYDGIVKSPKAPYYLMFCAFVGAMDMVASMDTDENKNGLEAM